MTMLPRPPTIYDKVMAVVTCQWQTAREIFELIGEGSPITVRGALADLADNGKIERRYDPDRNRTISRYRNIAEPAE